MARRPVETVQLKLRFSEALRRRLERAAKANEQSMNSEIVERLEASFRKEDREADLEAAAERAVTKAMVREAERAGMRAAARDVLAAEEWWSEIADMVRKHEEGAEPDPEKVVDLMERLRPERQARPAQKLLKREGEK